jgi:WD40 repeat protein
VKIRFDYWKGVEVARTAHTVKVAKPRRDFKLEPVAPQLVRTLVHPDRKASIWEIRFSPDGGRVMIAGYPSGVIQVFDVATAKELRRINTPPGGRSSLDYTVLDPEWKTLYVAIESRKAERQQKDDRTVIVPKHTGEVRVFDLTTGEEKSPLRREGNGAVANVHISPDGMTLITRETVAGVKEGGERFVATSVYEWELTKRTSRKLWDGYRQEIKSRNGRWIVVPFTDYEKLATTLKVKDAKSDKETVLVDAEKKATGLVAVSPDSRYLAASINGFGRDAASEVKVWDLSTLKEVQIPAIQGGVMHLTFSPDGKYLGAWDLKTGTRLISTKTWKDLPLPGKGAKDRFTRYEFSPDNKDLAIVATRYPEEADKLRDPDPLDFVQSRIYLYDLAKPDPPKVFVCPQGFMTKLEFDPKGRWLAAAATGGVWLFDVERK